MPEASPLLIDVKFDSLRKFDSFANNFDGRKVFDLNNDKNLPDIFYGVKYALVWKPDISLFDRLPDLEVLFSAGAGVDHILQSGFIPDVPIIRFVDHTLTTRMSEWVCLQCLIHLRQQRVYDRLQKEHHWKELPQPQASEMNVGIMGLGTLGLDSAKKLKALGFNILGWSRSKKQIDGIECFGEDELSSFLNKTDFLVGLLPLTTDTKGIFCESLFKQLRLNDEIASPVFINAGRGGSQIESDIVNCLNDGSLKGASLDVFENEPLSKDSPLWDFEQVIITPHMAATSDLSALAQYVSLQVSRYENGLELENIVDRNSGY